MTKGLHMGRRRVDEGPVVGSSPPHSQAPPEDEPVGRHYKSGWHAPPWLRVTALTMAAVLVLGLVTAGALFLRLQNNVTTAPLTAGVGNKSSEQSSIEETGSLQILILGTDTREGANSQY